MKRRSQKHDPHVTTSKDRIYDDVATNPKSKKKRKSEPRYYDWHDEAEDFDYAVTL